VPPRSIPLYARAPVHVGFEILAYAIASIIYLALRRAQFDVVAAEKRSTVICAAAIGAAVGSRLLAAFENPANLSWKHIPLPDGGKTIIGAILGGWIAVEVAKRYTGIETRTGDLLVTPLLSGTIVGRIGCFLAGTADETFGRATNLSWSIDFGDGVARHPLQLYEIAFLIAYYLFVERKDHPHFVNGDRFRVYVFSYFGLRFALEFLKDSSRFFSLDVLQWAALAGMLWCVPTLFSIAQRVRAGAPIQRLA
jgi:phosphatidylglycerol:prolipoprotein diacylglycerol transferase